MVESYNILRKDKRINPMGWICHLFQRIISSSRIQFKSWY